MIKKVFRINAFTIHELKKERGSVETELILSEKDLEGLGNESLQENIGIIAKIHQEFSGLSKHTIFEDVNNNTFKGKLEKFIEENDNNTFYEFTTKSLSDLEGRIKKVPFIVGGYYLYSDYILNGKRYIVIALIRNKEDFSIKYEDKKWRVEIIGSLNVANLAMGIRLNFDIYNQRHIPEFTNQNYLGLITSKGETISNYFKEWVAAANIIKDNENTQALIDILKEIDLPLDEENNPIEREEFIQKSFNQYKIGKSVDINVRELSAKLYGEENRDKIMNYAINSNVQLDNDFKRTPEKWRKLVQVSAAVEGIDVTIDYKKFNSSEVKINKNKTALTINNSDIIKQILSQYPHAIRD